VKKRLDVLLVERGLAESRSQAQALVMAGLVPGFDKPGTQVDEDAELELERPPRFVSRGGEKLAHALDVLHLDVRGRDALDVGASTGGFTDCLLQRGAAKVYAIDVGRGQIDWKLRNDPRVIVREGVNARYLSAANIGETVEICVADVSFISLTLILPAVFALLPSAADMIVLIKPQFELSPEKVGRGGVVRDSSLHAEAIEKIRRFVEKQAKHWMGVMESPLRGREGNVEFLAHIRT